MELVAVEPESELRCLMEDLAAVVVAGPLRDIRGQRHCCCLLLPPTEPHPLPATHLILHRHTQQLQLLHPPSVVSASALRLDSTSHQQHFTTFFKRELHISCIYLLYQPTCQLTSTSLFK